MLESFTRDLKAGDRAGLVRAARRAYLLALAALIVPGLLLGGLLSLTRPAALALVAILSLLLLALLLAAVALLFARQAAQRTDWPARQAALTAAIQAATAPGVVFLLGCSQMHQFLPLLAFCVLAFGLHLLIWNQLPGWVREPGK